MEAEVESFMSRIWILLLMVSLAGPVPAAEPVVLVVGDSLSAAYGIDSDAGWVTLLSERLQSEGHPHRVVNASIVGDTTQGGVERLPRALRVHQPSIVIIELGGNDGLRGYPVSAAQANLSDMVEAAQQAGAEVLLVAVTIPPNYGPVYRQQFSDMFRMVAESRGVPMVSFEIEEVAGQPGMLQDDGIHPTAAAQPFMLDRIWPVLAPFVEE